MELLNHARTLILSLDFYLVIYFLFMSAHRGYFLDNIRESLFLKAILILEMFCCNVYCVCDV